MNAVSLIYYLHMAFKAVKVTIILAWKKKLSSSNSGRTFTMNVQGCAISSTRSSELLLLSYFLVQGTN